MRALRPRLAGPDLALAGAGAALTIAAAYASVRLGAEIGLGALLIVLLFVASVVGFLAVPHIAVAATIVLFALIPMLKVFAGALVGPSKDLVTLAAVVAGLILFAFGDRQRRPDRMVLALVGLLLGLYVINVGGGHGIAWAQSVRLVGEPLLLLLIGFMLPQPRRTFRWAMWAVVLVACFAAAYGIFQQLIDKYTLVGWGYEFGNQVRTIGGSLRSFGTFDEPFAYAAFLLFGVSAVMFWRRRGTFAWAAGGLLLAGVAVSYVRGSLLVLVALGALVLARRGHMPTAVLAAGATGVISLFVVGAAGGTQSTTYTIKSGRATVQQTQQAANLVLNGRISAWQAALGKDPREWFFGRGVGKVGTGAARATYTLAPPTDPTKNKGNATQAVDSGYLAAIADVGILGLGVLLVLFGRLFLLSARGATRNASAAWVGLALLACMALDALTRASFTGFPTAFLGLLLVGLAISAAREENRELAGVPAGPAPL